MNATQIVQLDPKKVQADDNIRFGLKKSRIASLKDSIVREGGIHTPVQVERLDKPINGYTHKLTVGFYRHAAALQLNADGAALSLPAIEEAAGDNTARLRRQVSENQDRENLSAIDTAVAIKKLLDAGVSRDEVRTLFPRPGQKAGTVQPASPAFVSMMLSFLELPKKAQNAIHEGLLSVSGAYKLTKIDKAEQEAVIAKAEENRKKELEAEDRLSEREQKAGAKETAAATKLAEAEKAVEDATAKLKAADAVRVEKTNAYQENQRVGPKEAELGKPFAAWTDAEKKAFAERLGASKADRIGAEKEHAAAIKVLDKARAALEKLTAEPDETPAAATTPATPEPAKAAKRAGQAGAGKKAAIGEKDVKKAAEEVGAKSKGPQPLSAADMRASVKFGLTRLKPTAKGIFQALLNHFDGKLTQQALFNEVEVLTGERKVSKA